jgi:hypothetical protein
VFVCMYVDFYISAIRMERVATQGYLGPSTCFVFRTMLMGITWGESGEAASLADRCKKLQLLLQGKNLEVLLPLLCSISHSRCGRQLCALSRSHSALPAPRNPSDLSEGCAMSCTLKPGQKPQEDA